VIATLLIQLDNDSSSYTVNLSPQPGPSTLTTEARVQQSTPLTAIIVGVIALLIIVALLLVLLWCHRKLKRSVSPKDSVAEEQTEAGEEEKQLREKFGSKELLMDPILLLNGTSKDITTGKEVAKKKHPRRKKKQQEPEVYDGTRDYDMKADLSFFINAAKAKIKLSTRSKNAKTDPKYWITVPNEN